jgi:acyl-CoA synthetase (AMP-forming)/AMP-acid ligase II
MQESGVNYDVLSPVKFLNRRLEIITAGAPPAPKVIENVEAMGANITHVYCLTEVFGPHSVCAWKPEWDGLSAHERARLKSRQGVAYITAQYIDVVDPVTLQPVARDGLAVGEIVMRGNNVMSGYYKDPEATQTEPCPLQGSQGRGILPIAQDSHRQDSEVQIEREGVAGTRTQGELIAVPQKS